MCSSSTLLSQQGDLNLSRAAQAGGRQQAWARQRRGKAGQGTSCRPPAGTRRRRAERGGQWFAKPKPRCRRERENRTARARRRASASLRADRYYIVAVHCAVQTPERHQTCFSLASVCSPPPKSAPPELSGQAQSRGDCSHPACPGLEVGSTGWQLPKLLLGLGREPRRSEQRFASSGASAKPRANGSWWVVASSFSIAPSFYPPFFHFSVFLFTYFPPSLFSTLHLLWKNNNLKA